MNNIEGSITQLNNVNAMILITNVDGVKNKIPFKDFKLKNDEDLVLDFMFPPKTK